MFGDNIRNRPIVNTVSGSNSALATISIRGYDGREGSHDVTIARNVPWHVAHEIRGILENTLGLALSVQARDR